ncbi:MAG: hypothetical protein N2050_03630 [Flavobacteriales bacterium]|nr:hypothetical protein [Flavobacteriales bacterium]
MIKANMPYFATVFLTVVMLFSCAKENATVRSLEGTWEWESISEAPSAHIGVNDSTRHFFKFLPCKKAYTASCRCVYTIEKNWNLYSAPSDTFIYDLKRDELSITQFLSTTTAPNSNTNGILKDRRFTLILKDGKMELRNVQKSSFKIVAFKK